MSRYVGNAVGVISELGTTLDRDFNAYDRLPAELRRDIAGAHIMVLAETVANHFWGYLADGISSQAACDRTRGNLATALRREILVFGGRYRGACGFDYPTLAAGVPPLGYDSWGKVSKYPPRATGAPRFFGGRRRRRA